MANLFLIYFLIPIGLAGTSPEVFAQASSVPKTSIPGIVELSGMDPSPPIEELNVLDQTVKHASIVSLGETVHGSGGFVNMEQRISEYLIQKHGFRTLMIENPIIRSRGMTEWLASCTKGAPAAMPVQILYQPIQEDVVFFNWLCDFNQKHPHDPVVYRGMDIYDRPWEWQSSMEELNEKYKLGVDAFLQTTRDHCWFHNETSWAKLNDFYAELKQFTGINPANYGPCTQSLDSLRDAIHVEFSEQRRGISGHDLYSFLEYIDSAEGFQQNYNFAYQDFGKQWASRDGAQAKNELHIWKQEHKNRAIVITHSSHASKDDSPSDWWGTGLGKIHSNISFLKAMHGMQGKVVAIGITGYQVAGVKGVNALATDATSLDLTLHNLGHKVTYVDPYSSFVTAQERWFIENENSPGALSNGVSMVIKDNFDALFFVDNSTDVPVIQPWASVFYW